MSKKIEVIFVREVAGVGAIGTVKSISAGYWRNYLAPGKFAIHTETSHGRRLVTKQRAKDAVQVAKQEQKQEPAETPREATRAKRVERKEERHTHDAKKAATLKSKVERM